MTRNLKSRNIVALLLMIAVFSTQAAEIKGIITDGKTKEPLYGATVQIAGTSTGTITNFDGFYELKNLSNQIYHIEIRCVSYKTIIDTIDLRHTSSLTLNYGLKNVNVELEAVTIKARGSNDNEMMLLEARKKNNVAVESIGAMEMKQKGISNVVEGLKKITGVSSSNSSQLIVRGLGERYCLTTLNGLPIASPNPDNKLIPLELFPTQVIQNISVKKVYQAGSFADYAGAHIDIVLKESINTDFFNVSISTGGALNTLFRPFYKSDNRHGLWYMPNLSQEVKNLSMREFNEYVKTNDVFGTSFNIKNNISLPDAGTNISFGKDIPLKHSRLGIIGTLSIDNNQQTMLNTYKTTLSAQGYKLNEFNIDRYVNDLKITSMLNANYAINDRNSLNYTIFYSRNAIDDYKLRQGYDSELVRLIGSNSVAHVYSLMNNQIKGTHNINDRWKLQWNTSVGVTESNEPDRRQIMYRNDDTLIKLYKLNQQETMRYYGELQETAIVGDVNAKYSFNNHYLLFGLAYKNKWRNYHSTRFYYNINKINPVITTIDEIYDAENYINQSLIADGSISITKDAQPKSSYHANSDIMAGYTEVNIHLVEELLLSFGVRAEYAKQKVRYWNDASIEKISNLNKLDFFPVVNVKYNINPTNVMNVSVSRTITRPEFIEMAPFLYKESFGSDEIRGNDQIKNSYNYNIDFHYDKYFEEQKTDFISFAGYFKWLDDPIERVQESSGGSAVHSFRNADNGFAMGAEFEIRKQIIKSLKVNFNASYIYTNVVLPEGGGIYTDTRRPLQGASPYLINADITYSKYFEQGRQFTAALLYNLQGPRIHTVGIYGVENVMQKTFHSLNFNTSYKFNNTTSLSLKVENLLNQDVKFTQKVKSTSTQYVVERYNRGIGFSIGLGINL